MDILINVLNGFFDLGITSFKIIIFLVEVVFVVSMIFGIVFLVANRLVGWKVSNWGVLKAIFQTFSYLIAPREKGLKFIDKVVVTPIMRLGIFNLNSGFIKLGEMYNSYFSSVAKNKKHEVSDLIEARLGESAIVISAFQTKQFLIRAINIFVVFFIMTTFIEVVIITGFHTFLVTFFTAHISGSLEPLFKEELELIYVGLFICLIVFFAIIWGYIRRIISDIIFLLDRQQEIEESEFKEFIQDNLRIITTGARNINKEVAEEAQEYTIATFFK